MVTISPQKNICIQIMLMLSLLMFTWRTGEEDNGRKPSDGNGRLLSLALFFFFSFLRYMFDKEFLTVTGFGLSVNHVGYYWFYNRFHSRLWLWSRDYRVRFFLSFSPFIKLLACIPFTCFLLNLTFYIPFSKFRDVGLFIDVGVSHFQMDVSI